MSQQRMPIWQELIIIVLVTATTYPIFWGAIKLADYVGLGK